MGHMTPAEFSSKADYEGGWYDAIIGYGMGADDLDPAKATPEQIETVHQFEELGKQLSVIEQKLFTVFPDPSDAEDEEY